MGKKTPQAMHNSSSVIKMMTAVQWLLLVLLGGTMEVLNRM